MKINWAPFTLLILTIMGILLFLVLSYNGVDNSITEADKLFISKFLKSIPSLDHEPTYTDEFVLGPLFSGQL